MPQWTHLYPRRSATLIGASFGSISSPSAPSRSRFSLRTSSRLFTSTSGRSGFSGLWTIRISSSGTGRGSESACAIMDFPVPGGPTRRKWRRWDAATRARATASSCPPTRASGSVGISTSAVVSNSSSPNPRSALSRSRFGIRGPSLEVVPRQDVDPRGLLLHRAHLRPHDGFHAHLRRDVEDALRDDAVEHDCLRALPVALQGLHELPHGDLRRHVVVRADDLRAGRAAELQEEVAVPLHVRGDDLRGPRLRARLGPRLDPGLHPGGRRPHGPRGVGTGATGRGGSSSSNGPGGASFSEGLYAAPRPYISTYCSAGILFRRDFMICFCVISSTSWPRGARATKSTSATWRSSFRIRSPPRSPSRKAVTTFCLLRSCTDFGTFVPSTATAFLIPDRRRFRTSCRPSTIRIASLSATFGPAGRRSGPNEAISETCTDARTSSSRSTPVAFEPSSIWPRSCFARSTILFRFVTRTSSTFSTLIVALHGPTRSIVSSAAAMIDVSTWSRLDGIYTRPAPRPL